jgi:hypothetical protein
MLNMRYGQVMHDNDNDNSVINSVREINLEL